MTTTPTYVGHHISAKYTICVNEALKRTHVRAIELAHSRLPTPHKKSKSLPFKLEVDEKDNRAHLKILLVSCETMR